MSSVADIINKYGQETSTVYQRQQQEKDAVSTGKVTHTDFLKLLTKQLTSQDPLNPMQDIDFTAQLAQLQALDEQMAMTKSMQAMRVDTQLQAGTNMIGKFISGTDEAGTAASGMVSRVAQSNGNVYVELANKQRVDVTSVTNIWNDANSMYQDLANANQLVGMYVEAGVDAAGQPIKGIIEKIAVIGGEVKAKLYNDGYISLGQIKELREPTADEAYLYVVPEANRKQLEEAQKLGDQVITGKNADGKEVTGMVCGVEFDQNTFAVSLVLYSGDKIAYSEDVSKTAREPKAADIEDNMKGYYATGLNENGDEIGGVIIGARDNEDGLSVVVSTPNGNREIYWDVLKNIRESTDDEKKAAGLGEGDGGSGDEGDGG